VALSILLLKDSLGWDLFERALAMPEVAIARGLTQELGGVDDARVIPLLLAAFDGGGSSPELRKAALESLAKVRHHLPLTRLLGELRGHDSHTRMRALKLLETIGGAQVVAAVTGLLEDPELPVRATAAMVLARLGQEVVVSRLETMVSDPVNQRIVGHLERALKILRAGTGVSEERR